MDTRTQVRRLSVAQMQIVEIAKALSWKRTFCCWMSRQLRSPVTRLEALFAVLRRFEGGRKAIVFVSHKLEEVIAISDRVTVLRDGKVPPPANQWRQ